MNQSRRAHSPPFGYDPRLIENNISNSRHDSRVADYEDSSMMGGHHPYDMASPPSAPPTASQNQHMNDPAGNNFESNHPQPSHGSSPAHHHQMGYRDHHRLPSTYRTTMRDDPIYHPGPPLTATPPYKVLCINSINPKASDGIVKETLSNDFSRFGDITVNICHDTGERLAYIYFRSYEEARAARYAKSRSLLFDRPIEIEPIYEHRASPLDSPPPPPPPPPPQPQPVYPRQRSITPPEYYGMGGPSQMRGRPLIPSSHHHYPRPPSPSDYPPRYPHGPTPPLMQPPSISMPYGRGYYHPPPPPPSHMHPGSPYSSPPHETIRSSAYNQHPHPPQPMTHHGPIHHHPHAADHHMLSTHPYHPSYGPPPMSYERERSMTDYMDSRSPRHDPYYMADHRSSGYSPASQHSSRSIHSGSGYHQPPHYNNSPPSIYPYPPSSRRSPPPPPPGPPASQPPDYPARHMSREYRREKFGRDNYNIEPEEGRPSRVIFITNIDTSKTEDNLRDVFDAFGTIEELEVRKTSPGNASALIKYSSMDCAHKAKSAMGGKYLGKLKCRISYGKVSVTRKLWIGGFGPSTTLACLEDEFGKFGNIVNLDYISGRPYAYVEYDSPNQAQFATLHLKGTFAAQAERKLRMEYVEPTERNDKNSSFESSHKVTETNSRSRVAGDSRHSDEPSTISRKRSMTPTEQGLKRAHLLPETEYSSTDDNLRALAHGTGYNNPPARDIVSPDNSPSTENNRNERRDELNNNDGNDKSNQQSSNSRGIGATLGTGGQNERRSHNRPSDITEFVDIDRLVKSRSIKDMLECCELSWPSYLALKNLHFPTKMTLFSGRKATVEKYITKLKPDGKPADFPILRITQRWRLNPQPKLEEVKRRMQAENVVLMIITANPELLASSTATSLKATKSYSNQTGLAQQSTNEDSVLNANPEIDDNEKRQENTTVNHNGDIESEERKLCNAQEESAASDEIESKQPENNSTTSQPACASVNTNDTDGSPTQSRPLKNLITYLEQKDAAGVISLAVTERDDDARIHSKDTAIGFNDSGKLLYTFPPGEFALNLLSRKAPSLSSLVAKEEFLLGVIVGGCEAKM